MARSIGFDILANDKASDNVRKVGDEVEALGRKIEQASGTVEIDADTARFQAKMAALNAKGLKVDADIADAERKLQVLQAEAKEATGTRKLEIQSDIDSLQRKLAALKATRLSVDVDAAAAMATFHEVQRKARELDGKDVNIDVKVNPGGALSGLAAIKTAMAGLNGMGSIIGLAAGFQGLIQLKSLLAATGAGFASMGMSAIAGAGIMGGALMGVSDAVKALGETDSAVSGNMQSNANNVARAIEGVARAKRALQKATDDVKDAQYEEARAAEAITRAQEGATRAQQGVASAERNLGDAQRDARMVQEDLNDARKAAADRLDDLKRREEDLRATQASASLSVLEAEQRLQELQVDPKATELQKARARLNLSEAQRRTRTLAEDAKKLSQDRAEADKKGIEGSDEVQAALARQEAAQRRVEDAQRGIAEAHRQVTEAQRAVSDATHAHELAVRRVADAEQAVRDRAWEVRDAQRQVQEASQAAGAAGSSAADRLKEAMKGLTPEAQNFAKFLRGLIDGPLKQWRETAQRNLLPGLQKGMKGMFDNMPNMDKNVGTIAKSLGDMFAKIGPHVGKAIDALVGLAAKDNGALFKTVGDFIIKILDKVAEWANGKSADDIKEDFEQIGDAFKTAKEWMDRLWAAFKVAEAVWKIISFPIDVIKNPQKAVQGMIDTLKSLGGWFKKVWNEYGKPAWEWVKSGTKKAFDWVKDTVFEPFKKKLGDLGKAFTSAKDTIRTAWDKVKEAAAVPIRFVINTVIGGVARKFNEIAGKVGVSTRLPVPVAGFASGGPISGPGTGTSDDIPINASNGEWVIRASSAQKLGSRFMNWVNNADKYDMSGDPGNLHVRPGFANGGEVSPAILDRVNAVKSWLPSVDPLPYIWGGVGPGGYDCSGLVGEVWARLTGRGSFRRYMTTNTIIDSPGALGLAPGPGMFTIGVSRSHTAGNLGGLGFEAASSRSGIKIGSSAKSPGSFPYVFHLANLGTAGGGGSGGFSPLGMLKWLGGKAMGALTGGWWNNLGNMGAFGQLGMGMGKSIVGSVFDNGGVLNPGMSMVYNGTGKPEAVLTNEQFSGVMGRAAGGGATYVTIQVPVTNSFVGNEQQLAKVIVQSVNTAIETGTIRWGRDGRRH